MQIQNPESKNVRSMVFEFHTLTVHKLTDSLNNNTETVLIVERQSL